MVKTAELSPFAEARVKMEKSFRKRRETNRIVLISSMPARSKRKGKA
jgi:hypothetical protein